MIGLPGGEARYVVNVRGWAGMGNYRPPSSLPAYCDRLGDRMALVIASAAWAGAVPECFGLGAFLVVAGRSVIRAGLIVPDDLVAEARVAFEAWAALHLVATTTGPKSWEVVTLSEFYNPFGPGEFTRRAYCGADWCIGADQGRIFGIAAEHCGPRRGGRANTWEVWLPGWGQEHIGGRWMRRSPHRPPLRLSPRRVGWQVEFGPCGTQGGRPAGKQVRGRMWTGAFVDVLSLAYALDADRGASFAEHRVNFGLAPVELPIAVTANEDGAVTMAKTVLAIHEFALVLDDHASRWFTTPRDLAEGRGRLDLARISSPAAIAAQIPARFGLRPPLVQFDLTEAEHQAWCEAFHGGWVGA